MEPDYFLQNPSSSDKTRCNLSPTSGVTLLLTANNGSTVRDVVQQVFVGNYERLQDAYLHPWEVFERVDIKNFVGREWLLSKIDDFLRNHDRGYFILEANAGLGKTSFLAWLVQERGYLHHFVELAPGLAGIGRGLKNLAAQIVREYQLPVEEADGILPGAAVHSDYLKGLLLRASKQLRPEEKIVIVIDALDEAGTNPGQNTLGLPEALPPGVYFIVSQRPINVVLNVNVSTTPRQIHSITAEGSDNLADMRQYLTCAAAWPGVSKVLRESGCTPQSMVSTLLSKSRGLCIYLHYVVHEIDRGERSPLTLEDLPDGMTQYYLRHWNRWRQEHENQWCSAHLPLLATLAAAQEAINVERLITWSGVNLSVEAVHHLLNVEWRPFMALTGDSHDEIRYRFQHATLQEFFTVPGERLQLTSAESAFISEVTQRTHNAHERLVDRYLNAWGGLEEELPLLDNPDQRDIDGGYGFQHITAHLVSAQRSADLHRLLSLNQPCLRSPGRHLQKRNRQLRSFPSQGSITSRASNFPRWLHVKNLAGAMEGYLTDVIRAWRMEEERAVADINSGKLAEGLGLCFRYALIISSINNLAANIPPALLLALVEKKIWPLSTALAYARRMKTPLLQAQTLVGLCFSIDEPMRSQLVPEAFNAVNSLGPDAGAKDERTALLLDFVRLGYPHMGWQIAQSIVDTGKRECAMGQLAHQLAQGGNFTESISILRQMENRFYKCKALTQIAPLLPPNQTGEPLAMAQALLQDASHEGLNQYGPFAELFVMALCNPEERRSPWLEKALEVILSGSSYGQADSLIALAPYLQKPLLKRALEHAARDLTLGMKIISLLAPYLPEELVVIALQLLQAIPPNAEQTYLSQRLLCLAELVPFLPKGLRAAVVQEVFYAPTSNHQRVTLLLKILGQLPEILKGRALNEIVSYENLGLRKGFIQLEWVIEEVAPAIPEPARHQLLGQVLKQIGQTSDQRWRMEMLKVAAPLLTAEYVDNALELVLKTSDHDCRSIGLSALMPYLSQDRLSEVLELTQTIGDEDDAAFVSKQVVRNASILLARAGQPGSALEVLRGTIDEEVLADVLAKTVSFLSADQATEAFALARRVRTPLLLAQTLAALSPLAPSKERSAILDEASDLVLRKRQVKKVERSWDFAQLLITMPATSRVALPSGTIARVNAMAHEASEHPEYLIKLIPYLPQDMRAQILPEALRRMLTTDWRWVGGGIVHSLIELSFYIDSGLRNPLLADSLRSKGDGYCRVFGDSAWANRLREEALFLARSGYPAEALYLSTQIPFDYPRTRFFVEAVPFLPESIYDDAISIVRLLWGPYRSMALVEFLPQLSQEKAKELRKEALDAVWEDLPADPTRAAFLGPDLSAEEVGTAQDWHGDLQHLFDSFRIRDHAEFWKRCDSGGKFERHIRQQRGLALARLAPHLSEVMLEHALQFARTVEKDLEDNPEIWSALTQRLSNLASTQEALEVIQGINNDKARIKAHLSNGHTEEAWRALQAMRDSKARADTLTSLVSDLKGEHWPEILRLTCALHNDGLPVLEAVVSRIPDNHFTGLIDIVCATGNVQLLVKALECLTQRLMPNRPTDLYRLWSHTLQFLAASGLRKDLYKGIPALMPASIALGGLRPVTNLQAAIDDVNNWWP